ncbi:MAG: DUF6629 family protein [Bryobacteraceae bacterium]
MCFSATANFVGSAALGAIGVATLAEVKHPRQLLFAGIPLLFAVHQLSEGFVWLGLDNILPARVTNAAGAAFVMYAQGLLPFLLPLSVLLIEPTVHRRRRMLGFTLLGCGMGLYLLWGLIAYPMQVSERHRSIVYFNSVTNTAIVAILYVIATCGALFFSGFGDLVVLGAVNLAGLIVVMLIMRYAFTSVWCAYAAVVSVLIYFHFRRRRLTPLQYALAT